MESKDRTVFRPKYSPWPYIIHSALFAILLYAFVIAIKGGLKFTTIYIISPPFCAALIFLIVIYPTMRYELREDALYLICGPFKTKIDYSEIKMILKANLTYDLTSTGWKIPGYALFKIYYQDKGWVRMYSTRVLKNIIIIELNNGELYGISPKNEEEFLSKLKERIKK